MAFKPCGSKPISEPLGREPAPTPEDSTGPGAHRDLVAWVTFEGRTKQDESRRAREVVAAPVHHGGGWGGEKDLRDDPAGLELLF